MTTAQAAAPSIPPAAAKPRPSAMRRVINWIVRIGVIVAAGLGHAMLSLAWYAAGRILHPPGSSPGILHGENPKKALGLDYEDVEFPTEGGLTLRGWFVPVAGDARSAVITVHGATGDRT